MFAFFFLTNLLFQQTVGLDGLKRNILKRYSDLDYDSFVGLMGRRNAGKILFYWFSFQYLQHIEDASDMDMYYFSSPFKIFYWVCLIQSLIIHSY